jgi:hypothetical protein
MDIDNEEELSMNIVYSEGVFGINPKTVKNIRQHEDRIYMWFTDGHKNDELWDLELPFESEFSAKRSYNDLMEIVRTFKIKLVK